jgi:hypothetical protein
MLLSEINLPVLYADCKSLALVYPYEVAVLWYTIQEQRGDPRHIGVGQQLTDGRWMMTGDVLSEICEGGILAWASEHLTPEITAQIEVVPLGEALSLLPPATVEDDE